MREQVRPFVSVAEAIAELFSPHVEVVIHDVTDGKITHIANAFSKRRVGDDSLIADEPVLAETNSVSDVYAKTNWNGHRLRSISARLVDSAGTLIGYLCINHDVEALSAAQQALLDLLAPKTDASPPRQLFALDWREEVNGLISAFLRERNLTLDGATNADQDALLRALDQRGVFEVRTAPSYVASILGWSRQTLYARLKVAREARAVPELPVAMEARA